MKRENLYCIAAAMALASMVAIASPAQAAPVDESRMLNVGADPGSGADFAAVVAFRGQAITVLDTHKISRVDFGDEIYLLGSADIAATRVPEYQAARGLTGASLHLSASQKSAAAASASRSSVVTKITYCGSGGGIHCGTS